MLNFTLTLFLANFVIATFAQETGTYPADICYMVADLKYNSKDGVKICEIQQACLSLFNGDKFRNPHEESIHQEFLRVLSEYGQSNYRQIAREINGWVVADTIADKNLVATLASCPSWHAPENIFALFSDPNFKQKASTLTHDICDISSYHGFLYINWSQLCAITDFETRFAGMLILDKASFPLWIDKYRMTELFSQDPILAACKPKWGNYKKVYTPELAEQIARDLDCEIFVIKPRGEFLGNGVIITHKQDLDTILHYIITKSGPLATSQDPAYTCWKRDRFDSFIVEQFVASDPITIPHLENKTYQPTMRLAFVLVHNKGDYAVHFLGSYWKTPAVSLDQESDLENGNSLEDNFVQNYSQKDSNFMSQNKDICKPPYYYAVDPITQEAVHNQLARALPILHKKMVRAYYDAPEACAAPAKTGAVQIVLQEKVL